MGAQFIRLDHPDIVQCSWDEQQQILDFTTGPLSASNSVERRIGRIGRYRAVVREKIDPNGDGREKILCVYHENLDRQTHDRGATHPHSQVGEETCLGNMRPVIHRTFRHKDWRRVVNFLLIMLKRLDRATNQEDWPTSNLRPEAVIDGYTPYAHPDVEARRGQWIGPESRLSHRIVIVGVGTIGGLVAETVGQIGFRDIWLFDPQRVEPGNLASQAFGPLSARDRRRKVEVMASKMQHFLCGPTLVTHAQPLNRHTIGLLSPETPTIFMTGLDSMQARIGVYRVVSQFEGAACLIDGRMHGKILEVRTVDFDIASSVRQYEETGLPKLPLPTDNQCGMNAYWPAKLIVAGLMIDQLLAYLRGELMRPHIKQGLGNLRIPRNPCLIS